MNARLLYRTIILFSALVSVLTLVPQVAWAAKKTIYVKGCTRSVPQFVHPANNPYFIPHIIPTNRGHNGNAGPAVQNNNNNISPAFRTTQQANTSKLPEKPKDKILYGHVAEVIDGDTLVLQVNKAQLKIRLYGIDAPEHGQSFGPEAKQALSQKVLGEDVKVITQGQDKYGRTLGIVILNERNINKEMVADGMAWHAEDHSSQILANVQNEAQLNRKGLWSDSNPLPPWKYRQRYQAIGEE